MQHALLLAATSIALLAPASARGEVDERCPNSSLELGPKRLSDFEQFREAVRGQGYAGLVVIRLRIDEEGKVRDPVITRPSHLNSVPKVKEMIEAWRFCPAVRYGRIAAVQAQFHLQVESPSASTAKQN